MRCHHPHEVVLSLKMLSCVTTNESGLMIPANPAKIANEPPRISMNPAKLIQPIAAPLGLSDIPYPSFRWSRRHHSSSCVRRRPSSEPDEYRAAHVVIASYCVRRLRCRRGRVDEGTRGPRPDRGRGPGRDVWRAMGRASLPDPGPLASRLRRGATRADRAVPVCRGRSRNGRCTARIREDHARGSVCEVRSSRLGVAVARAGRERRRDDGALVGPRSLRRRPDRR